MARQLRELRAHAERLKLAIVEELVDERLSASKKQHRPGFERLMRGIESVGDFDPATRLNPDASGPGLEDVMVFDAEKLGVTSKPLTRKAAATTSAKARARSKAQAATTVPALQAVVLDLI